MKWKQWRNLPLQQSNKPLNNNSAHTQPNNLMGDLKLDIQQCGFYASWIFSSLCRTETACNSTQAGTKSSTQISVPQLLDSIWKTRSHGTTEIQGGETNVLFPTSSSSLQRKKKCSSCMSTSSRWHRIKILQVELTYRSRCLLQKIQKYLLKFQAHKAIKHPLLTSPWMGSDLLWEDGTRNCLC